MSGTTGAKGAPDAESGGAAPGADTVQEDSWCRYICYSILNQLATMLRFFVACLAGLKQCCNYTFYPMKEACFSLSDSLESCLHPYVKKMPVSHAPRFGYDAVASRAGTGQP
mmetsp:Transcript_43361/g.97887  ORF Transcript_43361/g.97887 Transcript_43361/m.97887 type:complete len:112 (+) Transcript_43361:90-425(+)